MSTQMLPAEVVFTTKLANLFHKTFVKGKENRVARATAREFALACLEASNKSDEMFRMWALAFRKS